MNKGKLGELTVAILDFNRPQESLYCLRKIQENFELPYRVLYVSNGGRQDYVLEAYEAGLIDELLLVKDPRGYGCGIGTKLAMQAALTDWVMYVQVDQFPIRKYTLDEFNLDKAALNTTPDLFYVDYAGNQGHGKYSERAQLINRVAYLGIDGIDDVIGGPGVYNDNMWTEEYVQKYIDRNNLTFKTAPLLFADNGHVSIRAFPCGGETMHCTDTKQLYIVKPLKQRYDNNPNLKLTDTEWEAVLSGKWVNGTIPEADKKSSFSVPHWQVWSSLEIPSSTKFEQLKSK